MMLSKTHDSPLHPRLRSTATSWPSTRLSGTQSALRPALNGAAVILGLAASLLAGSACGTVAVNDPESMSIEKFEQGAETILYDHTAEDVWLHVKETLVHLSSRQPDFSDATKRAFATVEAGSIQIGVVPIDSESCRMAVRAREYGLPNAELARRVLHRITEQIEP